MSDGSADAERGRLEAADGGREPWRRWGPYLSARQWGTVREDYSEDGNVWRSFTHDLARSRAYRWGEDGLLGYSDDRGLLGWAPVLWNGRDPILKERLFGLTSEEGNHGEDVKECWWHLDGVPSHAYQKALYRYPQAAFPYAQLRDGNARRGRETPEFELEDTGVFDGGRYFDVTVEYAKAGPEDLLLRLSVENPGPEEAILHVLPSLWFRNTWSWGRSGPSYPPKPGLVLEGGVIRSRHRDLPSLVYSEDPANPGETRGAIFTENETNFHKLYGQPNASPYAKDGFHEAVVSGMARAVNGEGGTKAAFWRILSVPPGGKLVMRYRLGPGNGEFGPGFDRVIEGRIREADAFHARLSPPEWTGEERSVARQARAGLLWTKQWYGYRVTEWLEGDPSQVAPPPGRGEVRNGDWTHFRADDVLSMPDAWEYPWFAAWDLAFHAVSFARMDPSFAKAQLGLLLSDRYQHPNGQIPAYEFNFSDANPPLHAWAVWRLYKMTAPAGKRDRSFLASAFERLGRNFDWWVARKDADGNNLFSGGFLGLDNIGVFDRSKPLPGGGALEQADGTAWMAFYCGTLLSMALELAKEDTAFEERAMAILDHYVAIVDAANDLGGKGLWDEADGFYYDHLLQGGLSQPLSVRSLVGLIPLLAVENLEDPGVRRLPAFAKKLGDLAVQRPDLNTSITLGLPGGGEGTPHRMLALPNRDKLVRVLGVMLDESEFLSPHGIRSLSQIHRDKPFRLDLGGVEFRIDYEPGESTTWMFGGNSNWRGPVWMPANFLLMEALERYHHFYGDGLKVECPTGSGNFRDLREVAGELGRRLSALFLAGPDGRRPCGPGSLLFHEYFHGETGRGLGASHQTGWTALAIRCLEFSAGLRRAGG